MKKFDQINVIPFIDIMLVLLAIVLMTATFIAQGKIDVNLPTSKAPATPPSTPKAWVVGRSIVSTKYRCTLERMVPVVCRASK